MKALLQVTAVLCLIFSLCTNACAENMPKKVRIGYLSLVNGQLISKNLKYHEQEMGIEVEWFMFNSGRDVNTAMASGSIDFGNVGLPPITIGLAGKLSYWGIMNANVLGAVESLVVRPNIKTLKDLEGKTVVTPFGSTSHYLLMRALADAGVDLKKVKVMDMAPGEALGPYIRGDIDAAYIWEPSLNKIVENGGKILLTSKQMADRGSSTWDIIAVQPEFAKAYPTLVQKFLKSELRAVDYWAKNPEQSATIVAKELGGISEKDAKRMMHGTQLLDLQGQLSQAYLGTSQQKGRSAKDIMAVSDFLINQGRIKNPVSQEQAETFLHPEFLEAVQAGH